MIVIGGINVEGKVLRDIFLLNTKKFIWKNYSLAHPFLTRVIPFGVAFH
jgi:hypothetical protein